MKEKILVAIKTKFPKVNLSKKRLDAIAAKIEGKVIDDETKIDAAIDDYNDFNPLSEIAKNDDKIRNLEAKVNPAPPKKDDNPADDPKDDPDMPAWAKALIKQNQALTESITTMQADKQHNTIKSKIGEKLKDVPGVFWNKRGLPTKDEDIEAFIEEVNTDYSEFAQGQTDKGLSNIPLPGGGKPAEKAAVVSPEIKAFAAKQAAAATPAKSVIV